VLSTKSVVPSTVRFDESKLVEEAVVLNMFVPVAFV
jgi:hypothetical protein